MPAAPNAPTFPVNIGYRPEYQVDGHIQDVANFHTTSDPERVAVPGDFEATHDALPAGEGIYVTRGKLTREVTVRFEDGFTILFPKDAMGVFVYDVNQNKGHVRLGVMGDDPYAPKMVQDGGRRRRTHRKRKARRATRRYRK